jgi:hypothetical protein
MSIRVRVAGNERHTPFSAGMLGMRDWMDGPLLFLIRFFRRETTAIRQG